jgi:microcin C transport system permease protein
MCLVCMLAYFFKRLFLIIPTLLGIMLANFLIVHAAPGGPVEYVMSRFQGDSSSGEGNAFSVSSLNKGATSTSGNQEMIEGLKKLYGFDQPLWKRFLHMMKNYFTFNFGDSYFKSESVANLIYNRLFVSLSLGLWTTILVYLVSIPLGIAKAVYNGTRFDTWSSFFVVVGYAVPSFLFALALIILFAGGSFWSFFPLRGLMSSHWADLSVWGKVKDYCWHVALPIFAQVLSGFASLSFLTKNSFLEEMHKQYVMMARAQGFTEKAILFKFVFRNAMLVVIAGLPATLIGVLFSGSLLIEMLFSIDGLGLLGYEAIMTRDYPIVFGSLYIFTLIGLLLHLMSDLLYVWIDPRIDYTKNT